MGSRFQLRVFFWAGALPVAAALGGLLLWKRRAESDSLAVGRAMAVLTATCLVSLVQFPFTVVIYFCYFAPLLVMLRHGRSVAGRPGRRRPSWADGRRPRDRRRA